MHLNFSFSASIKIFRVRIWLERASKKRQYHNNSYTSSQYALIFAEKFAIIVKKRASIILFDAHFFVVFKGVFRGGSSYPPCVRARNERSDSG